jgi:hypothetical protein
MADDVIVREEGGALVTEEDGYRIRNLDQAFRLAKSVVDGGMAPKGITEPGAVVAIWKAGSELGIPEMHALSALTFINGRIGIMVEAAMALVRTMGGLEPGTDFRTDFSGEGDEQGYTATAIKRGIHEPCQRRFTVRMAKRARLWGKTGPWQEYPDRMLQARALGFLLRDFFGEYLKGLVIAEEWRDVTPAKKAKPVEAAVRVEPAAPDPLLEKALSVGDSPPAGEMEPDVPETSTAGEVGNPPTEEDAPEKPKKKRKSRAKPKAEKALGPQDANVHPGPGGEVTTEPPSVLDLEPPEPGEEPVWDVPEDLTVPADLEPAESPYDGLCGAVVDESGSACGLPQGHSGDHEPL